MMSDFIISGEDQERESAAYAELMAYAEETIAQTAGWHGELLCGQEVEQRFGVRHAVLNAWRAEGRVVAFAQDRGDPAYPAMQFLNEGVVPGISELATVVIVPGELWRWLLEQSPYLDGGVPLEFLKLGYVQEVMAAAHRQYDLL